MHKPVLLEPILDVVRQYQPKIIMDATFGRGGYSRAFLETGAVVHAIDRDATAQPDAQALSTQYPKHFHFHAGAFADMETMLHGQFIDMIVFDLGVSSPQLDVAERGFSFRHSGKLDMRMDISQGETAADVVNNYDYKQLTYIFKRYGEERFANLIAKHIMVQRPFETTDALATLIAEIIPKRVSATSKIHPATRVFQALRIYVNDELGQLERGLVAAQNLLAKDGLLAVVSFHSLEDRIVKNFLAAPPNPSRHQPQQQEAAIWRLMPRKPIVADAEECEKNRRARSAKLRIAQKLL